MDVAKEEVRGTLTQDSQRIGALPSEYSRFVGRRALLSAARTELGATRLLTLLGSGGVGKTRFAIRLAQSVGRLYADGVWFIDLSDVGATDSVADEVSRVLELPEGDGDRAGAVARFIGARRGLLILDNCEQVADDCARFVRTLLEACPEVSVVATSRTALRLTAEAVFVVEPLATAGPGGSAPAPAVELFLDRCAGILPHPSDADLAAIAEICRRLEGIPLAIELAAARVRALTPDQILDRLAEPLALLTGGNRDVPDRQQTLHATIAWSYDLCTDDERALWRAMSVFLRGWDLESAEWMHAPESTPRSTLDIVQSLLEKSILIRQEAGAVVTYGMLETVREFGLEKSAPADTARARIRHRDWYLRRLAALEADWYGPRQAHWLALTRRELPNIRTAIEFCLATRDIASAATLLATAWRVVWQANGRIDELRRWCTDVLDLGADATPTPDICQVTAMLGILEILRGDPEVGRRHLARAHDLDCGDPYARAFLAFCDASVPGYPSSGVRDVDAALATYTESLTMQGGSNLVPARADVAEKVAILHELLGHTETAVRMREELIARAILAGDSYETALLLLNLGLIAAGRHEFDNATVMLRQALSLTQNLDNPAGVAQAVEVLAYTALQGQDYARSATLLGVSFPDGDPAGAVAAAYPGNPTFRIDVEGPVRRMLGTRAYDAAIARGRAWTREEGIAYALGAQLPARTPSRTSGKEVLSARESQVAALVGQGLADKEIAARLVISRRTAEGHVAKSLMKLGFTSRAQLVAWTHQMASA